MNTNRGVEIMVKLGPESRVSVDYSGHHDTLPILEITVRDGVTVMITPWVGVELTGPLTNADILVADQLVRAAEKYREELVSIISSVET